jgi:hypothetical protein
VLIRRFLPFVALAALAAALPAAAAAPAPKAVVLVAKDLPAKSSPWRSQTGAGVAVASLGGIATASTKAQLRAASHWQAGFVMKGRNVTSSAFVFPTEAKAKAAFAALARRFGSYYRPVTEPKVGSERRAGRLVASALQHIVLARTGPVVWSTSGFWFGSTAKAAAALDETASLARKQAARVAAALRPSPTPPPPPPPPAAGSPGATLALELRYTVKGELEKLYALYGPKFHRACPFERFKDLASDQEQALKGATLTIREQRIVGPNAFLSYRITKFNTTIADVEDDLFVQIDGRWLDELDAATTC